jgi:diadenosine tetraphosphate (Ap4A) HIT family hydrolase
MSLSACPFCNLPPERVFLESKTTLAFFDGYPVTEGHALLIPKRHVASIFELPPEELAALWAQVAVVRKLLKERYDPDAFNIGVNDGAAAGQTVPHAHIHVIPRCNGDAPDPRGGIRWIMPDKAKYW